MNDKLEAGDPELVWGSPAAAAEMPLEDPPPPLLPLMTLEEAQDVVEMLALVSAGEPVDREWVRILARNLAARIPSRD
ncbi:hypothetical protein OHB53_08630 [Streptomyces sp. NBC_00056]|uniref:hypothetical protein n=1 Tax=Streptomyces sp. NBC_00056 TaxID=2975633 RepID=UPI00324F7A07